MSADSKTIQRDVVWEGSVGTFAIEEAELAAERVADGLR